MGVSKRGSLRVWIGHYHRAYGEARARAAALTLGLDIWVDAARRAAVRRLTPWYRRRNGALHIAMMSVLPRLSPFPRLTHLPAPFARRLPARPPSSPASSSSSFSLDLRAPHVVAVTDVPAVSATLVPPARRPGRRRLDTSRVRAETVAVPAASLGCCRHSGECLRRRPSLWDKPRRVSTRRRCVGRLGAIGTYLVHHLASAR